ncbi:MAG: short-chain dehydrogenase [Acidimicrobiales bacterium]|jgi:2-hydroxycyclohexanecarboxyl-CoA dehydrogenase|nr:short-chain dehydrogenase [Acidimicrobiales bacterium]
MFDLSGRVALVTGAGQGVGRGIAMALAGQGAAVAVNDLHRERADAVAAELGGKAIAVACDVRDLDGWRAMVADVEGRLGPVDILVNNAGIPVEGMALTKFLDIAPEEWKRFVDLNLYGVLNGAYAVAGGMCERGFGRIITISSDAGRIGVGFGVSVYGAAKAGAVGLSRHLAVELGPSGVTVNTLSLGTIQRDGMTLSARAIPRGRHGRPEDVAAAVVWLASDEADWITGQTIPVNGGVATN